MLLTGFFMFAPDFGEIKDFCFSKKEELTWNELIQRQGNKSFSSQFARQESLSMEATYQWNRFELNIVKQCHNTRARTLSDWNRAASKLRPFAVRVIRRSRGPQVCRDLDQRSTLQ